VSQGVFNEGRVWQARKAFRNELATSTLMIGLYTNARDSLSHRNVLADIIPVVGSGYAPAAIAADQWTIATDLAPVPADDGVLVTAPANIFESLATWPDVTGAYLFDSSNGIAIAWKDHSINEPMPTGGKFRVRWLQEGSG
jgi:hypothetical protein